MLAVPASLLNVDVVILDVGDHAPAKQVLSNPPNLQHIDGSFTDSEKIRELASKVDVLTVEIEHVDVDALEEIARTTNVEIHPSPSTIRIIQDKLVQKEHFKKFGLLVADFVSVRSTTMGIQEAANKLGLPLMLKSRTFAYDGRGNYILYDPKNAAEAIQALGDRPLYAERLMKLKKEVAVMVVQTTSGEVRSYPVVETVHKDNVCHLVFAPFRHTKPAVLDMARKLAEGAVMTFKGAGVYGVEMFLLEDGNIDHIN